MSGWGRTRRCLFPIFLLVAMATFLATLVDRTVLMGQLPGVGGGEGRGAFRLLAGKGRRQARYLSGRDGEGGSARKVTSQTRSLKRGCRDAEAARDISDLSPRQRWSTLRHIIVNDEYRFLYCYVPKAACTTWKRVISVLEGRFPSPDHIHVDMYNFHKQNWTYLGHFPAASVAYRLQHYYKFMFVRDPLARVVSAYRDKFERRLETFSLKEAWNILERYRQGTLSLNDVSHPNITFPEFVQYVVDSAPPYMNEHWRPYLDLCQPCAIHYDFVGHLDTLEDDAKEVLSVIGADDKVKFPARQRFYRHESSEDAVNHYLSQLSPDLLEKLVSKYQRDYNIFGYKLPVR